MRSRATLMMGAALALGSLGAVSLPAPAGAQSLATAYTPTCTNLTVSLTIVTRNVKIVITGCAFRPLSVVIIIFHSAPVTLGTVTTDANGNFTASVTIPASASLGAHVIEASGTGANGQPLVETAPITVVSSAPVNTINQSPQSQPTSTGSQLPFTGADIALTAGTGGLLVVGGAAAIVATRRRDEAKRSRTQH